MKLLSGLKNCHAFGLDSVVLKQKKNGDLTRAFIAHKECTLNIGKADFSFYGDDPIVTFHNHRHHLLNFEVVGGRLYNYLLVENYSINNIPFYQYYFQSHIKTGKMEAIRLHNDVFAATVITESFGSGDFFSLTGNQIHTVTTKGLTIWVIEEQNNYKAPQHLSLAYHRQFNWKPLSYGLYVPMNDDELKGAAKLL